MPINSMSTITPLSKQWTHEQIVSEAMVLTNTMDNEDIQLDNVRNHLNASLSYISNLLNLAERPWYGVWLAGTLETAAHTSGLNFVDLSQQVVSGIYTVIPASWISTIKRCNFIGTGAATDMVCNATKWDISKLTQQANQLNTQNRHTLAWTWHGSDLLIYAGSDIQCPGNIAILPPSTTYTYDIRPQAIMLWGYRKPILDNLVPPDTNSQTTGNGNYRLMVDLPDEYVELLIKLIIQKIYTQRRERVPENLENEINQGVAQISQMISSEMQFEQAEREKMRYGHAVRPPGAM